MIKARFHLFALVTVMILVSALGISGQTCNLNLSVYSFENRSNEELIPGVSIRLETEESDKKLRPASNQQMDILKI